MLLKNVYQWDICNQEDLDIFSAESLEIDQSAARTLYRTDRAADPGQSRKRAEERAGKSTQRKFRIVRRKPNETREQWQKRVEKGKKKMPPSPVKEEPEEQLEEESEEEWTPRICTRAEFLERLTWDLELRNRRESGRNDGYSIIVKAVVERRDGNAARAEFVETEGPRLAHLVNPNGGRFLDWFFDRFLQAVQQGIHPDGGRPGRKHRPGRGIIQNVPGNIPQHRADASPTRTSTGRTSFS